MKKSKPPAEPDEMRMPADKFDEWMRHALDAPLSSETLKTGLKTSAKKPLRKKGTIARTTIGKDADNA